MATSTTSKSASQPNPPTNRNVQYYTLETLKNVTTAAAAITVVCGVIMNLYKQGANKEINLFTINIIALALSVFVVIANHYKRDATVNAGQHYLLILFNAVLLYASVAGSTGITSSLTKSEKNTKAQQNILSFFLPTRPLYGVTEQVYDTTKQALINANQIISATDELAIKRKDTTLSAVIEVNKNNVKATPRETKITVSAVNLEKIDTLYNKTTTYWVYLGQIINSLWQPKNFKFNEVPRAGEIIPASGPVYKRDLQPEKVSGDYWKLGKVIGVVNNGQKVKIIEIKQIEDNNYWARVTDFDQWLIIAGGEKKLDVAKNRIDEITKSSNLKSSVFKKQEMYRIVVGPFATNSLAQTSLATLKNNSEFRDAYVVRLSSWCATPMTMQDYIECR